MNIEPITGPFPASSAPRRSISIGFATGIFEVIESLSREHGVPRD
jgi:hypothetical protein